MSDVRNKIIGLKNFMDARIIGQKDLVNKQIGRASCRERVSSPV